MELDHTKIKRKALRFSMLLAGLCIQAFGVVVIIECKLGAAPWDVFHLGAYQKIQVLTLGQTTIFVGVFIVLISYFLKVPPRLMTFASMFFFGVFLDFMYYLNIVPTSDHIVLRFVLVIIGTAILGFGTATYLSAKFGSGPRDSLMLGLSGFYKINVGWVRMIMEVGVTFFGYLLGGGLGIGTIIHALTVGIFVNYSFRFYKWLKLNPIFQAHMARFLGDMQKQNI